jgi:hypothetical protein
LGWRLRSNVLAVCLANVPLYCWSFSFRWKEVLIMHKTLPASLALGFALLTVPFCAHATDWREYDSEKRRSKLKGLVFMLVMCYNTG